MTFLLEAAINWVNALCKFSVRSIAVGNTGDYVILLHALAKTDKSMQKIASELGEEGYVVINLSYPSRKHTIEELSELYLAKAVQKLCIDKKKRIHFVGYSLGCIIIRKYLQDYLRLNLGRVVMIAPPNHGSEIVEFMMKGPLKALYKWWFGPAGQQLGASKNSYINKGLEKSVKYELGIIAGDCCINPIVPFIIKKTNDGRVSIKSTKLKGMKDHIVIHSPHCFVASNDETIKQVAYFLRNGQFYTD